MKKRKLNRLSSVQLRNRRKKIQGEIRESLGRMKQILNMNSPEVMEKAERELERFDKWRKKYGATLSR